MDNIKILAVKGILGSSTYIVQYKKTTIIIDSGAQTADVIKMLDGRSVDAILLTHEHFDHVFYAAEYADTFNCPIFAHTVTIEEFKTKKVNANINFMKGIEIPNIAAPQDFNKFSSIKSEDKFTVGDFIIKPYFCPGHSAGSIIFQIGNTLFTGDVLFDNTIGRTDLMPNGPELMQKSLRKLKEIKYETAYHGHGRPSDYEKQLRNILAFIED